MSITFFQIFLLLFCPALSNKTPRNFWFLEMTRIYENLSSNVDRVIEKRERELTNNFTHLFGSFCKNYYVCWSRLCHEIDGAEKYLANLTECLNAHTTLSQVTQKPCTDILGHELRFLNDDFERIKCVEKISPILLQVSSWARQIKQ